MVSVLAGLLLLMLGNTRSFAVAGGSEFGDSGLRVCDPERLAVSPLPDDCQGIKIRQCCQFALSLPNKQEALFFSYCPRRRRRPAFLFLPHHDLYLGDN